MGLTLRNFRIDLVMSDTVKGSILQKKITEMEQS